MNETDEYRNKNKEGRTGEDVDRKKASKEKGVR
jgi:hypothetical protein